MPFHSGIVRRGWAEAGSQEEGALLRFPPALGQVKGHTALITDKAVTSGRSVSRRLKCALPECRSNPESLLVAPVWKICSLGKWVFLLRAESYASFLLFLPPFSFLSGIKCAGFLVPASCQPLFSCMPPLLSPGLPVPLLDRPGTASLDLLGSPDSRQTSVCQGSSIL